MSDLRTVTGVDQWRDLLGERVRFNWADGYGDSYDVDETVYRVVFTPLDRVEIYWANGGGMSLRSTETTTVLIGD